MATDDFFRARLDQMIDLRHPLAILTTRVRRAPCKGGAFLWVRIPPGSVAPAGSNRSGHGGNEVAEAFGVEGHGR